MRKKVTLKDVSRYAGVSVASVSNVINNINKVSEETREKILKAIEDTGYQMDYTARCLKKGISNLIGVMLPITEEGDEASILLKNNPFFSEFISGVEYMTRQRGYDVLIAGVEKEQKCKEWIVKRNLDGLILLGINPQTVVNELQELELPVVLTDIYEEYPDEFCRIIIEDERGGYLATRHLIELGHRKIALATGSLSHSMVNIRRFNGYKKALEEAGIKFEESLVIEDHVSFDGGYKIGSKILESDSGITAVFAVADIMAFGVIKAFSDYGKLVPDDYSIIGFDDLKMCEYISPGLTTIRQDVFKKGITAAEAIINEVESQDVSNESILLPVELVVRGSTKKI